MAFVNSTSPNMTTNNTFENIFPAFKCYKLPITVGNDTFCGNLTRWESRYSEDGLKAMVLVPAILALLVLLFRLWRSKSAVRETYETMMKYEKHMFQFRKNEKLEKTDSMNSVDFEMCRVGYGIERTRNQKRLIQ